MTAYGPQGIPRARAGGPGWPRSSTGTPINADINGFPAQYMIVRTDQQIRMPSWASFYRAGATGNGGRGAISATQAGGGGGAAFSGTATVPEKAAPGTLINVRFEAAAVVVEVLGYRLFAGHGADTSSGNAGVGGVATGGAVNFNGGKGGAATSGAGSWGAGGSAASRAGPGVASADTATSGTIGAQGTAGLGYFSGSAPGGSAYPATGTQQPQPSPNLPTSGGTVGAPVLQISAPSNACSGGDGGGGSGGVESASRPNIPGPGFAILEFW